MEAKIFVVCFLALQSFPSFAESTATTGNSQTSFNFQKQAPKKAVRKSFQDSSAIENSMMVSVIYKIIKYFDRFAEELIPQMMKDFMGLFTTIATALLVFVVFQWLKSGDSMSSEITSIFLLLALVTTVMMTVKSRYYFNYLYMPISEFAIGMPNYIISIASTGSTTSTIQGLFGNFDKMVSGMFDLVAKMLSQVKWYKGGLGLILEAFGLYVIYSVLRIYFMWVFLQGILSVLLMLIFLPFGIMLAPFSATRGLFNNTIKATASYALMPTFASIILGIILYAGRDIIEASNSLLLKEEFSTNDIEFTKFFMSSALLGGIGIFMLGKASEYSNQIMMGAISTWQGRGATKAAMAGSAMAGKGAIAGGALAGKGAIVGGALAGKGALVGGLLAGRGIKAGAKGFYNLYKAK